MLTNNVTFVTCYFKIYDEDISLSRSFEKRLELFLKIADTGINICIFISPDYREIFLEIAEKYKNIQIVNIYDKNNLKFSKKYFPEIESCLLPENRSHIKDTKDYITLMNSKIDFVNEAIHLNPFNNEYFCWFDFALPYIFKDFDKTIILFKKIAQQSYSGSFLIIPGCWNFKMNDINYIKNKVCWRFCGGFFIGDKNSLSDFYKLSINNFGEFLNQTKTLVWEVNFWTWLESYKSFNPIWYPAEHNDSIINIPEDLYNKITLT